MILNVIFISASVSVSNAGCIIVPIGHNKLCNECKLQTMYVLVFYVTFGNFDTVYS
jgi:hypothetical protein